MKQLILLVLGLVVTTLSFRGDAAPYAVATRALHLNGYDLFVDSFDSADPLRSTGGQYDPAKSGGDQGHIASEAGVLNSINVGTVLIWGGLDTGFPFSLAFGAQSSIGSSAWHQALQTGIEPGFHGTNYVWQFPDVVPPFFAGLVPTPGSYNGESYTYILNLGDYRLPSLTLSGGQKMLVTSTARLDITGNVSLSGNSQIVILPSASLQLFVGGTTANIRGNGILNQGVPRNFMYYGTGANTELHLRVTTPFVGLIYAPRATCTVISGGNSAADMQGAAVVQSLELGADVNFHFDEELGR